jgi:transcriptional regulator with XRE-family HTH domain
MDANNMNRLKVVLAEKNIQSKWISEQLGVSRATVSKWVNNTSQPSLEMIDKLAKLLDVDYTELLRLERKLEKEI